MNPKDVSQPDSEATTGIFPNNTFSLREIRAIIPTEDRLPAFLESVKSECRAIVKGQDLAWDIEIRQWGREQKLKACIELQRTKPKEETVNPEQKATSEEKNIEADKTFEKMVDKFNDFSHTVAESQGQRREQPSNLINTTNSFVQNVDQFWDAWHRKVVSGKELGAEDTSKGSDFASNTTPGTKARQERENSEHSENKALVRQEVEAYRSYIETMQKSSYALGRPPEVTLTQPRTERVAPTTWGQKKKARRKKQRNAAENQPSDADLLPPSFETALQRFRYPKIAFDEACVPIEWRERVWYAAILEGSACLDAALCSLDLARFDFRVQTEILHWFQSQHHCEDALEDAIKGLGKDLGLKVIESKASEPIYTDVKYNFLKTLTEKDLVSGVFKGSEMDTQGKALLCGFVVKWFKSVRDIADKAVVFQEQFRPSSPVGDYPCDLEETMIQGATRMFDVFTAIPPPNGFAVGDDVLAWLATMSYDECMEAVIDATQGQHVGCGLKIMDKTPTSTHASRAPSTERRKSTAIVPEGSVSTSMCQENRTSESDKKRKEGEKSERGATSSTAKSQLGIQSETTDLLRAEIEQELESKDASESSSSSSTCSLFSTWYHKSYLAQKGNVAPSLGEKKGKQPIYPKRKSDRRTAGVSSMGRSRRQLRQENKWPYDKLIDIGYEADQSSCGSADVENEDEDEDSDRCLSRRPIEPIDGNTIAGCKDNSKTIETGWSPEPSTAPLKRARARLRGGGGSDILSVSSLLCLSRSSESEAESEALAMPPSVMSDRTGTPTSPKGRCLQSFGQKILLRVSDFEGFLCSVADWTKGRPLPFEHVDGFTCYLLVLTAPYLPVYLPVYLPAVDRSFSSKIMFSEDAGATEVLNGASISEIIDDDKISNPCEDTVLAGTIDDFSVSETRENKISDMQSSSELPFVEHDRRESAEILHTDTAHNVFDRVVYDSNPRSPGCGENAFLPIAGNENFPHPSSVASQYSEDDRNSTQDSVPLTATSKSSPPPNTIFSSSPSHFPADLSHASSTFAHIVSPTDHSIPSLPLQEAPSLAFMLPQFTLKLPLLAKEYLYATLILPPDLSLERCLAERGMQKQGPWFIYTDEYVGLWKAISCDRCWTRHKYQLSDGEEANTGVDVEERELDVWDVIRALGDSIDMDRDREGDEVEDTDRKKEHGNHDVKENAEGIRDDAETATRARTRSKAMARAFFSFFPCVGSSSIPATPATMAPPPVNLLLRQAI